MFYHSKCKSFIYLNITDNIVFLASFGVAKSGLKLGQGDIIFKGDKFESKFYCAQCREEVSVEEIDCRCSNCGESFKITSLYKLSDNGGIYCSECIKLFPTDGVLVLSKLFNKVLSSGL